MTRRRSHAIMNTTYMLALTRTGSKGHAKVADVPRTPQAVNCLHPFAAHYGQAAYSLCYTAVVEIINILLIAVPSL